MIQIRALENSVFEVIVRGATLTVHRVTAAPEDVIRLTGDPEKALPLIEESFLFLLDREPNTAIFDAFSLVEIGRYFPDYEQAMKDYFT